MKAGTGPRSYSAFVSYRHLELDRYWARRVLDALEQYRIPRSLQRQGYPERIGALFRDEDEIPASTDLTDQIQDALAHSSILIVICSPDTPSSKWIRREITLFQEMGKGDKIFPVLIAGEPDQSFPPELRRRQVERKLPDGRVETIWEEVEPIAADVRVRKDEPAHKTFERAIIRLAAAALGVRFDDLHQREQQRQRESFRRIATGVAAALVAVVGGALWYWDSHMRVKTTYCMAYGERLGVPFCVGSVSEDTARQQYRVYRLKERGGLPQQLERLNGSLSLAGDPEVQYLGEDWTRDTARFEFSYLADGTLSRAIHYDSLGRRLRELVYTFSGDRRTGVVRFERDIGQAERQLAEGSRLGFVGSGGSNRRTSIGQHRLTFDGAGFVLERRFEPVGGGATSPDGLGAYGRAYKTGVLGLVEAVRNLDAVGDTLFEKTGVAELRRDYDDLGRLTSVSWHTKSGDLVLNSELFAKVVMHRDGRGCIDRVDYRNTQDQLVMRRDWGVARITYRCDERGNLAEQAFFGIDGKPILRKDWGAARVTRRHDERGASLEDTYWGVDGQPILTRAWGVARARFSYDERGHKTEEAYFGADGKPMLRKDIGAARMTWRHDERGNSIEEAYFGIDGKPILRKDLATARLRFRYDDRGNIIEEAHYGADGELILDKNWGAARATWRYDERGNAVETAYFGTDGKPSLRKDIGAARLTSRYDERGNAVETSYFGTDGQPILRKDIGVARMTWRYDERGNNTEEAYFDGIGRPMLRKDIGIARLTMRYDERGYRTEEAYFGVDGQPILRGDIGAARMSWRYDERGNQIEEAYFGSDNQPIMRKNLGSARLTSRYDEFGNKIEESYFGVDGRPVLDKNWGVSRATWRYDERGNAVETAFFGTDGKPMLRKDIGAARLRQRHDERGDVIETAYFDTEGKPILRKDIGVARMAWVRDERGNEIEETYFGTDGKPILRKDIGAAHLTMRYDSRGNKSEEVYFDTAGKPILRKDIGVARLTIGYDGSENVIEYAYFGADGRPVARSDTGVARTTSRYDERRNLVETHHFDAEGKPVGFRGGAVASVRYEYDEAGREIARRHFSVTGKPLLSVDHANLFEEVQASSRSGDHARALATCTKIVEVYEKSETASEGKPGLETATQLGGCAWYALFARQPDKALKDAERGLSLAPDLVWIATNKAHALMYLGRKEEARAEYLAHRGKLLPQNGNRPWEQVVVEDFATLRQAGREHPLMAEIEALFAVPRTTAAPAAN